MRTVLKPVLFCMLAVAAGCAKAEFSEVKAGPPLEVAKVNPLAFEQYPCPTQEGEPVNEKKALVCHVPPGKPEAQHNICISKSAVDNHLDHAKDLPFLNRDYLGICVPLEDRV
jgi:hypothetical protein